MNKRALLILAAIALATASIYFAIRSRDTTLPAAVSKSPPLTAPAPIPPLEAKITLDLSPPPIVAAPANPEPVVAEAQAATVAAVVPPEVPIQDGATIDFSMGAAMVRAGPEEKAIIDRAVMEMEEAAKNISFGPSTTVQKK